MTIASLDSPIRPGAAQKTDPLDPKNSPNTRAEASEFGQVMSGIMAPASDTASPVAGEPTGPVAPRPATDGQVLAEALTGLDGLNGAWGGDFLKAVHLGPRLNVITAETAAPDEQSLEAFARSQGLDETAVQWLMGTAPGQATPAQALPAEVTPAPTPPALALPALASSGLTSGLTTTVPVPVTPTLSSFSGQPSAWATAAPAHPTATALPGAMVGASAPAAAAGTTPSNGPAHANGLTGVMQNAALWAMAQPTEKAHTPPPATEGQTDAAAVSVQMLSSPAPTAVWMLRHAQGAAPGKEAPASKSGIALSEIDLSEVASPELLDSLSPGATESSASPGAHPNPLSGHSGQRLDPAAAARLAASNPDAAAGAPETGPAQRSENIQNLAEKMGQAVGERILSEIEKGQWHLKLSLRPATLGHIEVEMRMRSGELDAVFTTSQALTRELLQESLPKLKDTLNQMGMDVASFHVGDGQTQQGGGESTPGKMSKSTNPEKPDSTPLAPSPVNTPRMKMGQDGWDVLV